MNRKEKAQVIAIIVLYTILVALVAGAIGGKIGHSIGEKQVEEDTPEMAIYSIPATVLENNNDKITIIDLRGEFWQFYSDLPWEKGDEITVIFDSKDTGSLLDDEIISVNWNGEYEAENHIEIMESVGD